MVSPQPSAPPGGATADAAASGAAPASRLAVFPARAEPWLAALALFTGLAGDVFRYSIGWIGWGVLVGLIVVACVVVLVRRRTPLASLPLTLVLFLGFAALSTAWSAYPAFTGAGTLLSVAATAVGLFLAQLGPRGLLLALSRAMRAVLALSLAFEAFVSLVLRHRILPLVPDADYASLQHIPASFYWSRNLLLHGGRIQGIMGNSNLLAWTALVGLIVFAARWAAGETSRVAGAAWVAVALVTLALTRSGTVIVAGVACALVAAFVLLVRRARTSQRRWWYIGGGIVLAAGVATVLARADFFLNLLGKSDDLTFRSVIWSRVLHLVAEQPVGGWGWVSYWVPWVAPFKGLATFKGTSYFQAHDAWLDVLLQLGVVGLVLFIAYAAMTLAGSWRAALRAPAGRAGMLLLAPLLLVVATLVQSIAESRMLIEGGWALFAALAILAVARTDAAGAE